MNIHTIVEKDEADNTVATYALSVDGKVAVVVGAQLPDLFVLMPAMIC